MDNGVDSRHEAFARFLGTTGDVVERAYDRAGGYGSIDRHELAQLKSDGAALDAMEIGLRRALNASRKLSEVQVAAFKLLGAPPLDALSELYETVKCAQSNRQNVAKNNTVNGRGSTAVTALAQATSAIFDELRRPITFGTKADSNEPSTDFARAVKEAVRIYGIANADGTQADWLAAARSEYRRRH